MSNDGFRLFSQPPEIPETWTTKAYFRALALDKDLIGAADNFHFEGVGWKYTDTVAPLSLDRFDPLACGAENRYSDRSASSSLPMP